MRLSKILLCARNSRNWHFGCGGFSKQRVLHNKDTAQQSVHPTLGILARFQVVFYASAFFQSDGVPPPAPARVTQTVSRHLLNKGK
jgi:hypothetical protein